MTREQILTLAAAAGAQTKNGFVKFDDHAGELEMFVKLILAAQKEQK